MFLGIRRWVAKLGETETASLPLMPLRAGHTLKTGCSVEPSAAEGRKWPGNQPLGGEARRTDRSPLVGSPASRRACKIDLVRLALAFGEKAIRSAIAPPSSLATISQRMRLARSVEIQTSRPRCPVSRADTVEVQSKTVRLQLFSIVSAGHEQQPPALRPRLLDECESGASLRLNSWTTRS